MPVEGDDQNVRVPHVTLDNTPVGNPSIGRAGEEIQVAIKIVWGPFYLELQNFL